MSVRQTGKGKQLSQREILKRRLNSLQHELQQEKEAYAHLVHRYGKKLDERIDQ